MSPKALLSRLPIDPYIAAIVGMVCLASIVPAHGVGAVVAGHVTTAAIALLFFLHGARLEPRAALAGARHWRLHVVVLASTFLLFPALGLLARAAFPHLLTAPLWTGLILLCVLPSDSPILDRVHLHRPRQRPRRPLRRHRLQPARHAGNPAAGWLPAQLARRFSISGAGDIVVQLLLPFAAGQLARPLIGEWALRNRSLLGLVDRGSILLVVYTAFSEGVTQGIWHQLGLADLGRLMVVDAALLAAVLADHHLWQPLPGLLPRR